jgi:hypothetical protein
VINSGPASSPPTGYRFPREVIAVAVRWYLPYGLSYRDVEELLAERGIEVDHVTIYRWVQTFTPEFIDAARASPARNRRSMVRRRDLRQGRRTLDLSLPRDRSARPRHRRPALATPRRHRGACVPHPRDEVPTCSGRGHNRSGTGLPAGARRTRSWCATCGGAICQQRRGSRPRPAQGQTTPDARTQTHALGVEHRGWKCVRAEPSTRPLRTYR